jgi:ABC-type multidrug transport system ATPase subunit
MQITLTDTGKRFNREWIFRHCSFRFEPGKRYAITGPNGSGKSTLLQVIAGATMQSEGKIEYNLNNGIVEAPYQHIAIAAPYLELIEEMTAIEFLRFHETFKQFNLPLNQVLEACGLAKASGKQIRYFSSGMKQRLKLAQAFFCKTPVLLLDEPLTNLDKQGAELYLQLTAEYGKNRLVIISSNDPAEYVNCDEIISIADFKN